MTIIGYSNPKNRYSVMVFDIIGTPVQDRQRCANKITDAYEIALKDMKDFPLSCACIYIVKRNTAIPVRNISPSGNLSKPKLKGEE